MRRRAGDPSLKGYQTNGPLATRAFVEEEPRNRAATIPETSALSASLRIVVASDRESGGLAALDDSEQGGVDAEPAERRSRRPTAAPRPPENSFLDRRECPPTSEKSFPDAGEATQAAEKSFPACSHLGCPSEKSFPARDHFPHLPKKNFLRGRDLVPPSEKSFPACNHSPHLPEKSFLRGGDLVHPLEKSFPDPGDMVFPPENYWL